VQIAVPAGVLIAHGTVSIPIVGDASGYRSQTYMSAGDRHLHSPVSGGAAHRFQNGHGLRGERLRRRRVHINLHAGRAGGIVGGVDRILSGTNVKDVLSSVDAHLSTASDTHAVQLGDRNASNERCFVYSYDRRRLGGVGRAQVVVL
jgi:hypothetical protein